MKFDKTLIFTVSLALLTATSCADEDLVVELKSDILLEEVLIARYGSLDPLMLPHDFTNSKLPEDQKNPISQEKVTLGKFLFHETGLALNPTQLIGKNTYSCASCHHVKAGFQSGMKQGIGEGGLGFGSFGDKRFMSSLYDESSIDIQPIRSPTILNSAFQDVMLWNGQFGGTKTNLGTNANWTADTPKENNELGYEGVETQAIAGLDVHRLKCDPEMILNSSYKELFDSAYPEISVEIRYTKLYAALAIAAYERSVIANEAPYQKWLRGDYDAINVNEKQGALLFFGKANCISCHDGPALNDMAFHAIGMNDLVGDNVHGTVDEVTKKGRGGFTNNPLDNYKFKTPTIYNLKGLNFLGHGGSFGSIKEVIEYKNIGMPQNKEVPTNQLSVLFEPLGLTELEIAELTEFVENALYDDNLERYVPITLPTGLCFPVADDQSKIDMGCD